MIDRKTERLHPRFPTKEVEQGYLKHLIAQKLQIQAHIKQLYTQEDSLNKEIARLVAKQQVS